MSVLTAPGTSQIVLRGRWGDYHWESDEEDEMDDIRSTDMSKASEMSLDLAGVFDTSKPSELERKLNNLVDKKAPKTGPKSQSSGSNSGYFLRRENGKDSQPYHSLTSHAGSWPDAFVEAR